MIKILKFIISVKTILKINFIIIAKKIQKKKIIIFYHPAKDIFAINYYLKSLFKFDKSYEFLILSQEFKAYSGNEFFLVDRFLSMIIHSDFFITNNVCDYFPFISKRIYIHHDIYDTPLTSKKKEAGLKQRLLKYNFVLVSSDLGKIVFENLFKQEQHKPEIISIGYLKLDFLIQKYKQKKNRSIVIAITNFNAFRDF